MFRDDPALSAGSNMMTKMLRHQKHLIEKYKKRQQRNEKERSPKVKPSKLSFEDTTKTKAFNKLFQQNLLLVLHSPSFCEYFANSGFTVVKVRLQIVLCLAIWEMIHDNLNNPLCTFLIFWCLSG